MFISERHLRYEGWPVVAACGVGAFFAVIPLTTFGVFLKPLCDHFSWSRESASAAYAALTMVAAVSAPGVGTLLDRVGARRVIVPCLAVSGCAVASLSAMTSSLWHLWLVFGLLGLATMGASPIAYSRAIFSWFDAHRGRAVGVMLAGASLSAIVVPAAAQALILAAGWRTAWLVLGLASLTIALPTAVRFIRDREPTGDQGVVVAPAVSLSKALCSRVFWTLAIVVFGGSLATSGAVVHMAALLVDRGAPAGQAALSVSALGAASLVGRLLTGWLLDRFDAARISVLLLMIAAAGTLVLAAAHSLSVGIVAAICIGFGAGGEMDVTPYLLSRHFGLQSLSTLYGFNWSAWGLAAAAGPILLGRAFDATGSYTTTLVEFGFITLAAAALMLTFPAAVLEASARHVVEEHT